MFYNLGARVPSYLEPAESNEKNNDHYHTAIGIQ